MPLPNNMTLGTLDKPLEGVELSPFNAGPVTEGTTKTGVPVAPHAYPRVGLATTVVSQPSEAGNSVAVNADGVSLDITAGNVIEGDSCTIQVDRGLFTSGIVTVSFNVVAVTGSYRDQVMAQSPVWYSKLDDLSTPGTVEAGTSLPVYSGATQRGRTPTIVGDDAGGATPRLNGMHDWITAPHEAAMAVAEGTIIGHAQLDTLKERNILFSKGDLVVEVTIDGALKATLTGNTVQSGSGVVPIEQSFLWGVSFGAAGLRQYLGTTVASVLEWTVGFTGGLSGNTSAIHIGQTDGDFLTRAYGLIGHVAIFGSQLGILTVASLCNPQSATSIYTPTRSYRGQFLGQVDVGSGGGNTRMRTTNLFEFVPPVAANVDAVRLNLRQGINAPGDPGSGSNYSFGDGGIYDIYVVEFDPSTLEPKYGVKVGGVNGKSGWAPGELGFSRYEFVAFDNPIAVQRGRRYAVAFENVSVDPNSNYSSNNQTEFAFEATTSFIENHLADTVRRTPWPYALQPRLWATFRLRGEIGGEAWGGVRLDTTDFGGSEHWLRTGTAYGGRLNTQGNFNFFGANNMGRLRFTPGYAVDVDGLWINAMRRSVSAGDLLIDLKVVGGATLETATFSSADLANIGADHGNRQVVEWRFFEFASVHSLAQGTEYELLMRSPDSADSSNCCVMSPMRVWINAHPGQVMPPETWYRHGGLNHTTVDGGSNWDPIDMGFGTSATEMEWGGLLLRCVP